MVFQNLGYNYYWRLVGPHDIVTEDIHNLTTPTLNRCFQNSLYSQTNSLDPDISWQEQATQIKDTESERLSINDCLDTMISKYPLGYIGFMFLTNSTSIQDKNTPFLYFVNDDAEEYRNITLFDPAAVVTQQIFVKDSHTNTDTCLYDESYKERQSDFPNRLIEVEECIAFKGEHNCQLYYNPLIGVVVIIVTLVKTIAILLAAWLYRSREPPLLTTGDAIASFLENPDKSTEGMCWSSLQDFKKGKWAQTKSSKTESCPSEETYQSLAMPRRLIRTSRPVHWIIISIL